MTSSFNPLPPLWGWLKKGDPLSVIIKIVLGFVFFYTVITTAQVILVFLKASLFFGTILAGCYIYHYKGTKTGDDRKQNEEQ